MTSNHRNRHRTDLVRGSARLDERASLTRTLLACTALVSALLVSTALPVWAAGGAGGSAGVDSGGTGGSAGGFSGTAGGGLFGTPGATGGNDAADVPAGGPGGGGGGGGGFNGNGAGAASISNSGNLAGTNGGNGGAGPSAGAGGGGGGGEGGFGAIVTGNGSSSSNSGTISGGTGGNGGASGSTAGNFGGNGGDGGIGLIFTGTSATFTNTGTVSGGKGGAGGAAVGGGSAGTAGAGGAGIVGSSLTIINGGTISGGFSGDNATRANAITFTGGTNILELQSGSIIAGNVVDTTGNGTLRLGGSVSSAFDASTIGPAAQYRGFATFIKTGTSTWTLGGTTTALTPWTVNQGTLAITSDGSLGNVAGALTLDGGTLQIANTLTMNRNIVLGAGNGTLFTVGTTGTLAGTISGSGNLTKAGVGTIAITGTSNYTGTTTISLGTLQAGSATAFSSASAYTIASGAVLDLNGFNETVASVAGAGNITLGAGTLTTGGDNTSTTLSGHISGTGGLTKGGTGTFTLSGTTSYSGATNVNTGVLQAGAAGVLSSSSAFTVAGGATLDLNNFSQSIGSLAGAGNVTLGSGTLTTGGDNTSTTFSGTLTGTGGLVKQGTGIFTVSSANAYTGPTSVNAGTFQAGNTNVFATGSAFTVASGATLDLNSFDQSIASLAGAGTVNLGSARLTAGADNTSTTFSGDINGTGGLTKTGTGTLTLSGPSTYSGNTSLDNGTLLVNGSIASSSVTVNSGATLGGNGTVGPATIASGGTLAPGSTGAVATINVNGTFTLNPGSVYAVDVTPAAADKTVATGTASLAGTAQVNFQGGSYAPKSYTIVTSAGLGGTTFDAVTLTGTPSGFSADVAYTTTDALLNLTATLGKGQGLDRNQQVVANAMNSFFNGGGSLPPDFLAIYGQSGSDLQDSLTRLSGEPVTAAQQGAFQMMNRFLGVMLDPFVGRLDGARYGGGALGFASERADAVPSEIALGYSARKRASHALAQAASNFGQRWSVWGAGFGGVNETRGDSGAGSHDTSVSTYGIAVGADYQFTPDALAGLSVSGGGTRFDVTPHYGGGSSDAFQIGAYGVGRSGPLYVAASTAFANHWMQTERFGPGGDRLAGNFTAQSFGARVETGYRLEKAFGTISPYIAAQAASFFAPGYSETDRDRGPFALTYNSRDAHDIRSELGARLQSASMLANGEQLVMHGRLAWAHDWISDPSVQANFQALPGASVTVTGAAPATDSALASAGFEVRMPSGISFFTKFDGEFASRSVTYGGTGTLRYRW
jgi:autotransporter-associated beta strand protein